MSVISGGRPVGPGGDAGFSLKADLACADKSYVLTPSPLLTAEPLADVLAALDPVAGARLVDAEQINPDGVLDAWHELQARARYGLVGAAVLAGAASICHQLIAGLLPTTAAAPLHDDGLRIVVATPAGDAHLVDGKAVAVALGAEGWPVDLLLGTAGHDDLGAFLAQRPPMALVVVCAEAGAIPAAARALRHAHQAAVPVLLAGPGFGSRTDYLRSLRLGADGRAAHLADAVALLGRWRTARPVPDARDSLPAEADALEDVVASMPDQLGVAAGATEERRRIAALGDHLAAAVIVDDSRVLLDFVRSELLAHSADAPGASGLVRLVHEIGEALPADMTRARRFVDEAVRYIPRMVRDGSARVALPAPAPAPSRPLSVVPSRPSPAAAAAEVPVAARPALDPATQGRVFADLLLLGAMVGDTSIALVSLPREGRWSTLWHGAEKEEQIADPALFNLISERPEPVEITDFSIHPVLKRSPLGSAPLGASWLLGIPLRGRDGSRLGVLCLLHRQRRELSKAQVRAVRAVARQLEGQLELWRRPEVPATSYPSAGTPGAASERAGRRPAGEGGLLRSHEVASMFDVTERTVINWAASGKLPSLRTVGGHLRFRPDDVANLLTGRPSAARSS